VDALPERAEQEGGGVPGGAVVALAVLTEAEQNGVDGHLVHLHVRGGTRGSAKRDGKTLELRPDFRGRDVSAEPACA
jgi:hypothetical protein